MSRHNSMSQYTAFQNFFWIENPLNIKEVMSKNISDNNNAAMLLMSYVRRCDIYQ